MSKFKRTMVAFLSIFFLAPCHTIRLENDLNKDSVTLEEWDWNHAGVYGLVTYSDDFRTKYLCGDSNWKSVSTGIYKGPLYVRLGMVFLSTPFLESLGILWSPTTIS